MPAPAGRWPKRKTEPMSTDTRTVKRARERVRSRRGPRPHLRHHAARRRAMPRRDHDLRGEAARSPTASTTWASTSSRPAFPIASQRRFRGRRARSPSASRTRWSPGSPAPSPPTSTAPARRCGTRARPRIHTFVSTSPIHLAHQMRKTEDEVLEIITATVTQARNLVDDVEWSRRWTRPARRSTICAAASRRRSSAGATTINLPDTVGYATPEEYGAMFRSRARARAGLRQG